MDPLPLLVAQLACTLPLVGLVWTVQIVQYPLFSKIDPAGFVAFHREHARRIGWIVGPLMLLEAAAAGAWALWPGDLAPTAFLGLGLLVVVWASTVFLQVPDHRRLESGLDLDVARRLVATNWVRTLAWSARGALLVFVLSRKV